MMHNRSPSLKERGCLERFQDKLSLEPAKATNAL